MQGLIWSGTLLTLAGIGGLVLCVLRAVKARKSGLDDEAMRNEMRQIVLVNVLALGISGLGLMLVVLGIVLR